MKGLYRKAGELYGSSKTPNGLRKLLNDYNDTLRRTGDVNESKRLLEISARKYYGDDVYDFYQRKMFRAGDDTDVHNVLQAMKKEAGYIVDSLDGAFNIANRFGRSFHIRTHEYRYMLKYIRLKSFNSIFIIFFFFIIKCYFSKTFFFYISH